MKLLISGEKPGKPLWLALLTTDSSGPFRIFMSNSYHECGVLFQPLSATAPNHRNLCRCGMEQNWKTPPSGFPKGQQQDPHAATAPNHGNLCRCGMEQNWETPLSGFPKGQQRDPHAATAPNHRKCCHCGKRSPCSPHHRPSRKPFARLPLILGK